MTKREIAGVLKEIAFFLRLREDNPYRARAYEQAGESLLLSRETLDELVSQGLLTSVKGIGRGTASVITELYSTGQSSLHRTVRGSYPSSLAQLGEVPGLTLAHIRRLYEQGAIQSLSELQAAVRENRLHSIKGIGPKGSNKIADSLGEFGRGQGYHLYGNVLSEAAALEGEMRSLKGVERVSMAGGLRRRLEVVNEFRMVIDIGGGPVAKLVRALRAIPDLSNIVQAGPHLVTALSPTGTPLCLVVASPENYEFELLQATGSSEHTEQLAARLRERGLRNWDAVKTAVRGGSEAQIYEAAALPYVEPELREGRGELDLYEKRGSGWLLDPSDIQGTFHLHTVYSDGIGSVEEMVQEAQARGYRYLGISDHSQSAHYANGLKEPRIREQWEEIRLVQRRFPAVHIFRGIEADILPDGSMDYPDSLLAQFDFVIASVHSRFNLPEAEQTHRICKALSNPYVTMLGHPTGRLLLSRPGYRFDMRRVVETASAHRKILEINGSRHRLDLDWRVVRWAKDLGVMFSINPDAHAPEEFRNVELALYVGRKGALHAGEVVNAKGVHDMKAFLTELRANAA
jgi:DNA polymerase (family 10)